MTSMYRETRAYALNNPNHFSFCKITLIRALFDMLSVLQDMSVSNEQLLWCMTGESDVHHISR